MSQVVIEFPSLQGRVGGIYAEKAGASPAVAQAIAEHYLPLSAVAPVPATLAGGLVAVADKIDNIAGAWVAGEKPSGSRDPYGLRRAAMGIVRIALEQRLRLVPRELADQALAAYAGQGRGRARRAIRGPRSPPSSGSASRGCCSTRACPSRWSRRRSARPRPTAPTCRASPSSRARSRASRRSRIFNDVVVAYTRPASLAAKAAAEPGGPASPTRRCSPTRPSTRWPTAVAEVRGPLAAALAGGDVESARSHAAAALRAPIDRYFDDVLVMDKDPAVRANRLAQLVQITALLGSLGDFGRLPVQQG